MVYIKRRIFGWIKKIIHKVREEERRLKAEKEQEVNSALRSAQKQLSKEQKEARDKLMQQYGYVADGGDDEEESEPTDLTPRDRRRGKTLPSQGKKNRLNM